MIFSVLRVLKDLRDLKHPKFLRPYSLNSLLWQRAKL